MSIFEQASRKRLTFSTARGVLCVDDLWDLPLTSSTKPNLNDIAVGLHKLVQETEISFVDDAREANTDLQLRFDIVKHIIDVKKKERDDARDAAAKKERKQKLMEVLARKQDVALESMSEDEIKKLIDETA
jgi:hypothetical protein